jgi:hypothetical protein
MPTLTFTTDNTPYGGILNSRVLIGRRISPGISLSDPSVSRLHAWIDPIADEHADWIVTDAGSKTGTFVNDQRITRQPLHDGDRIRIGTVTLTYHDADVPPRGVKMVALAAPPDVMRGAGILFECACGSPLWVSNDLAGKRGMCRHCRKPVTVPAAEGPAAVAPAIKPSTSKRIAKCAVCHSPINEGEETTQCPDCAMNFHAECWQENFGCSSYGCPQVEVLKPKEEAPAPAEAIQPLTRDYEVPPQRWDTALLAASVLGFAVGTLVFGGTALIVAVLAVVVLLEGKHRPLLLILAIVISVLGIAAGLGISDFWYFNGRHLPTVFMHR